MTYGFHPDALVELEQTASYYDAREAGLGIRFIGSPESFRGCLTHVFPHGILYTIEQDQILILAVMPLVHGLAKFRVNRRFIRAMHAAKH